MTTSTTDKSLTLFFETLQRNQQASRQQFPERYAIMQGVDHCFTVAGPHLGDVKPIFTGPMFIRSQYAYKAAAGMTLSGQFSESFVMMRSCLEYAGYALLIFTDPHLEEVFLNRHVSDASKKAQRKKFGIDSMMKAIASFDLKLSKIFKDMYDRSIDYGGHPNPHGMIGSMDIRKDVEEQLTGMTTFALAPNPNVVEFAMHKVSQVGLTGLYIFRHVFAEKFVVCGVSAKMDVLGNQGL